MGAPVVHFEINAKDLNRAKEFYSSLFGWEIHEVSAINYGLADTGVKMGITESAIHIDNRISFSYFECAFAEGFTGRRHADDINDRRSNGQNAHRW